MIVLVNMKSGETKKAFIRNQIFHEVDVSNKKREALTTANIDSVIWLIEKKPINVPIKKWMELAEKNDFWGMG